MLGIAGLFLPVLQGILFLAVGASLLASEIPWVERQVAALKARHPKAAHAIDSAEAWVAERWRRLKVNVRLAWRRLARKVRN